MTEDYHTTTLYDAFLFVAFIVTPALAEPLPGWVDSLNGPVGVMIGAGKGVIRSMMCNGEYKAEVSYIRSTWPNIRL